MPEIGRTLACASAMPGASEPVPTISSCELSARDRKLDASADAAAVRRRVTAAPSRIASGAPLSEKTAITP